MMDHVVYHQMCLHLLNDTSCYEILPLDPTASYKTNLLHILSQAKMNNLISAAEFDFIFPQAPCIATFYSLPKIHKGLTPLKGRPIVSGVDCLSQNCGIYVDKILSPLVQSLPSFIRDTTDLFQHLDGLSINPTAGQPALT